MDFQFMVSGLLFTIKKSVSLVWISLTALFIAGPIRAQQPPDTLAGGTLPEVRIRAARSTATPADAPFSVSLRRRSPETVALSPVLSLDDVIGDLPGLWVQNRSHFALGERLSVRGMGWRAPFGVRGVQVVLDGIPLTLPDGQTYAEIVGPTLIRRAELVRGPASRFWGNGSGGALFLSTDRATGEPFARLRAMGGRYGARQGMALGGVPLGRHYVQGYVSDTRQDGFRNYSEGRRTRAGLHGRFRLSDRTRLRVVGALADQDTEHPGSLTQDQYERNPRLARSAFKNERAGKTSTQGQLGVNLRSETPWGRLDATAYGLARDLDNPLPFGYISYARRSGGARLSVQRQQGRLEGGLALDAAFQRDDRTEWQDDDEGNPVRDSVQVDQVETVLNGAASGFLRAGLTDRLRLSLALRASRIRFESDDDLIDTVDPATRGDQSGTRSFTAWSPSAGLSYRLSPTALLFANYSTAFETPTTTELVNRPDASGGFNPNLDPQKTRGVEIGARGGVPDADLRFDAAVFYLNVEDALVQTGTTPAGLEVFGNASGSVHAGAEVAVAWTPRPGTELRFSYTGGRYAYDGDVAKSDTVLAVDGNRLPGLPPHRLNARLEQNWRGLRARVDVEAASGYFVDDANTETARTDGYASVDVHLGHEGLALGPARLQPFAEIGNVLGARYVGSIIPNAFGGRYYEPAPGRTWRAGLSVTF